MALSEDPREIELKIERANRIASRVTDQTTIELLGAWVEELRQKLRQLSDARRTKHEIKARARELWEQNGCPSGRDLEFWLQAESEIKAHDCLVGRREPLRRGPGLQSTVSRSAADPIGRPPVR
jgi:hypothetical protein